MSTIQSLMTNALALDQTLFSALNRFAGQSALCDGAIRLVATNPLFKGVFAMLLFWFLWFANWRDARNARARLVATVVMAVFAIFAGRALALSLPFRLRPMHRPDSDVNIAIGQEVEVLAGWSSFPSDHAVMHFAIATGLFLIHRGIGMISLLHATVIISLPRIYLGLHYPSDIVAGASLGILLVLVLMDPFTRAVSRSRICEFAETTPHLFYPLLFLVTFQIATLFDSLRTLGSALLEGLQIVLSR